MATDFYIPKLGEAIEQATIVDWLVEDGVEVDIGDEILELETDKAVVPVPANAKGYLHIGPYKAGDVVPIMAVVATIGKKDETFAPGSAEIESEPEEVETTAATDTTTQPETTSAEEADLSQVTPTDGKGAQMVEQEVLADLESMPKATPVAQKMATDLGLDLHTVTGSGERGKITKEDVLQATSAEKAPAPIPVSEPTPTPPLPAPPTPPTPTEDVSERVPLKGVRGIVTRRMAESAQTTARVALVTEVDATELVALREQLKGKFSEEWGFAPGYNELLAMIVANALRQFPYMNARLSADGEAIEHLKPINIGVAVDTERGLLVTVLRDVDKKGLQELGANFRELIGRARAGKSTLTDLSGGTFTISNLGMHRIDAFTPVINLPEAAILGVGRIMPKPVVQDEEIVIRKMLTLSLVIDHRLADGAPAARFLDYICELIEEPYLLFLTRR